MYSITQHSAPVVLTNFPRSYYLKAGFYLFFGWLWASLVFWIGLCIAFGLLIAIGAISTGFLSGLFGGLRG